MTTADVYVDVDGDDDNRVEHYDNNAVHSLWIILCLGMQICGSFDHYYVGQDTKSRLTHKLKATMHFIRLQFSCTNKRRGRGKLKKLLAISWDNMI